jgi:hypothetical protein
MTQGFIDGDLAAVLATFQDPAQHLADLADDMIVIDKPRGLGAQEFRALVQHAFAAVGDARSSIGRR